ncbi:MAG: dihydroneopterin aldolase [Pseudomonadota bacterium]
MDFSLNAPRAGGSIRTVFVAGLVLDAEIGCYESERGRKQPVRIDIAVDVRTPDDPLSDRFEDAMCYHKLTEAVRGLVEEGHVDLVETLAEKIARLAAGHPMALAARVRVAKPEAIEEADAVGVEIRIEN